MKNSIKSLLFVMATVFVAPVYADTSGPCGPGLYAYVGDKQADLLARCGKPTTQNEYVAQNTIQTKRLRWVYNPNTIANVAGAVVGTQGVPFTVEFVDNKVTSITVAGESYTKFEHCGVIPGVWRSISVGDDTNRVRAMCGPPVFVNTDQKSEQAPPIDTLEYRYSFDSFTPPTIVTIQNGIVTQIK